MDLMGCIYFFSLIFLIILLSVRRIQLIKRMI